MERGRAEKSETRGVAIVRPMELRWILCSILPGVLDAL
jgi:hypothetical protein